MQDRIKHLRKSLALSQTAFANRLGVAQQTVCGWENGNSLPAWARLLICSVYHVRREWLEDGEGEVFDKTLTDALAVQRDFCLRLFESLDVDLQRALYSALCERVASYREGAKITVDNSPGAIVAGQINGTVNGANFGGEEEEEEGGV